jgi:hypothetical protein
LFNHLFIIFGRFIAKALLMVWHWYRILWPPSHTGADPEVVRRTPFGGDVFLVVNGTSMEHHWNSNVTAMEHYKYIMKHQWNIVGTSMERHRNGIGT